MDTFEWLVDDSTGLQQKSYKNTIKYGDGYGVDLGLGLHNTREVWDVNYSRTLEEVKQVKKFLVDHRGDNHFLWTTPFGRTLEIKVSNIKLSTGEGIQATVSAVFTEVI